MPSAKARQRGREEGVLSESPQLLAWSVSESDFPGKTSGMVKKMKFLLRYAILAPCGHNTQPWLFKIVGNDTIELYADRSRTLPVVDPDDREVTISGGTVLYYLRLAANHFGLTETVELLPDDKNNRDLLARISFKEEGDNEITLKQNQQNVSSFEALTKRRSNRSPFENKKLPDDLLVSLKDIARAYSTWFDIIDDELHKNGLADLISQGDKIQLSDKKFRRQLAAWIHPNRSHTRDGMPGYAHGIPDIASYVGPLLIRTFDMGEGQAAKDRQLAIGSPAY